MEVNDVLYVPGTSPPRNIPGNHRIGGWVDPRVSLEVLEKRSLSCPFRKIESRIAQFVPSHCNDSVIPMNRGRNCDSNLPYAEVYLACVMRKV